LTRAVFAASDEEELSWKQGGEYVNPQDAKYIITDLKLPGDPVKLADSWVTVRYYASMILPREVIESDTLRVVFGFDSHIKIDGVAKL
jgi:hypothetical protein